MNRFLSYSGGVESTTMLLMFGGQATPIFADTGWEHEVLYRWLEEVESKTGITIVRVKREDIDLPGYILRQKFAPSPFARFCTRMFKIEPIDEYLASRVPCELMIGLNVDETDLRVGNLSAIPGVTYSYPLVELGITRSMCVGLLKEYGLLPKFPAYMQRGGCKGCFFKSKKEYSIMARESPVEADEVADLEDAIQDEREKHFSIRDGIKSMRAFITGQRQYQSLPLVMEDDEKFDVQPSPCGLFCRR
jgi:hypothetical protein